VARELAAGGDRAVAVTVPGQGDGRRQAALTQQLAAVLTHVDWAPAPVVLVGHSAAATLAWMVVDARPRGVARAILVGGFPSADGAAYFDDAPLPRGMLPFPGWEPFEGPDAADLDAAQRAALAARAIPVPAGVVQGAVHYGDDRHVDVPVTLVCPEFSPEQAREWVASGVPERAQARRLDSVDLRSGHCPMVSCPAALAALLRDASRRSRDAPLVDDPSVPAQPWACGFLAPTARGPQPPAGRRAPEDPGSAVDGEPVGARCPVACRQSPRGSGRPGGAAAQNAITRGRRRRRGLSPATAVTRMHTGPRPGGS
jgi:pimeloyl-ACP methyl ester carboxylesterase